MHSPASAACDLYALAVTLGHLVGPGIVLAAIARAVSRRWSN